MSSISNKLICGLPNDVRYLDHFRPNSTGACADDQVPCIPGEDVDPEIQTCVIKGQTDTCPITDIQILNLQEAESYIEDREY